MNLCDFSMRLAPKGTEIYPAFYETQNGSSH